MYVFLVCLACLHVIGCIGLLSIHMIWRYIDSLSGVLYFFMFTIE